MRSQEFNSLAVTRSCAAAVVLLCAAAAGNAQHSQSIYLPDPTPRPPDLQREYGDDPVARARQREEARLRSSMRLQEVVSATNQLTVLAQQLKDQMDKRDKGTPMSAEMVKTEQIEKLAKKIKETMKSR
jgi:hypothetical protein